MFEETVFSVHTVLALGSTETCLSISFAILSYVGTIANKQKICLSNNLLKKFNAKINDCNLCFANITKNTDRL
jgi:hypothetical protein